MSIQQIILVKLGRLRMLLRSAVKGKVDVKGSNNLKKANLPLASNLIVTRQDNLAWSM